MEENEAAPEEGGAPPEDQPESRRPPGGWRSRHRRRRRRRTGYRILIAFGVVLAAVAIAFQVHAWVWTNHSERVGAQLIQQERSKQAKAVADPNTAACLTSRPGATTTTAADASAGPQGLLEIPRIGLTAPVEQGVDDA
ncbi:MAG TPA: hypothetical protein VMT43_03240, partial [Acidimicrobiales bacterium]|nr:hypothetical protein [Acidimicrobiales bacterium]